MSVRLWDKLFFVSEFVGKSSLGKYMTQDNITKGLIVFFVCYYLMAKVL